MTRTPPPRPDRVSFCLLLMLPLIPLALALWPGLRDALATLLLGGDP